MLYIGKSMSENNQQESKKQRDRRPFSIRSVQRAIDTKLQNSEHFSNRQIETLQRVGEQALLRSKNMSIYSREVLIPVSPDDTLTRHDRRGPKEEVVFEDDSTLYGYIEDFSCEEIDGSIALCAEVHAHEWVEGATTHIYTIPMAFSGRDGGLRIFDAPQPIVEHDLIRKGETEVQGYVDIVAEEVLSEGSILTTELVEIVEKLKHTGRIENLEQFTAAFNSYLQECSHIDDPWFVEVGTAVERLTREDAVLNIHDANYRGPLEWISTETDMVLRGVEISENASGVLEYAIYMTPDNYDQESVMYRCRLEDSEVLQLCQGVDDEGEADDGDEGS